MSQLNTRNQAHELITELNRQFQSSKQGHSDEVKFQEYLNRILRFLTHVTKENNDFFIELERFYQGSSFLIGLGNLELNDNAYKAWKDYDHFHYDQIKTQLSLYYNSPVY